MMRVTLFGTRGSLATSGVETSRYGETPRLSRCAGIAVRYWFSMPAPASADSGHNSHRKPAVSTFS